jgi:hypothetical protein
MNSRALGIVTTLALAATGLTAGSAAAAPPVMERESISETFSDKFLSDKCGVAVTTTVTGFVINRAFQRDGAGPRNLFTINVKVTARSGENTFSFNDVGADIVRTRPNGDEILTIVGKIPFDFNGVRKINLTTGEVVQEPRDISERMFAEACAALTA